jgi:hypothetical protein
MKSKENFYQTTIRKVRWIKMMKRGSAYIFFSSIYKNEIKMTLRRKKERRRRKLRT